MEIKTKIENNVSVQENKTSSVEIKRNNNNSLAYNIDFPDFSSYLQELDEKKPKEEQPKTPVENPNQTAQIKEKPKAEEVKTEKSDDKKEKNISKIDKINEFKNLNDKKEISSKHKETVINLDHITPQDMNFFKTMLENPSMTINGVNSQNLQVNYSVQNINNQISYKSAGVSKGLFNLIENSFKSQKPVRVDFNGNSSVILKMNNEGKLIAEFISNDKAMEYVLKNSLPSLKERLDAEGITYEEISYKENPRQNRNKKQNQGGEE